MRLQLWRNGATRTSATKEGRFPNRPLRFTISAVCKPPLLGSAIHQATGSHRIVAAGLTPGAEPGGSAVTSGSVECEHRLLGGGLRDFLPGAWLRDRLLRGLLRDRI